MIHQHDDSCILLTWAFPPQTGAGPSTIPLEPANDFAVVGSCHSDFNGQLTFRQPLDLTPIICQIDGVTWLVDPQSNHCWPASPETGISEVELEVEGQAAGVVDDPLQAARDIIGADVRCACFSLWL